MRGGFRVGKSHITRDVTRLHGFCGGDEGVGVGLMNGCVNRGFGLRWDESC